MEWINVQSVEELKKLGSMKKIMLIMKKDIESLFKDKKSRDKNIIEMITIKSNSWQGLFDKVVALREVINHIDESYNTCKPDRVKSTRTYSGSDNGGDSDFFKSKETEYIFYLLELDGKQRAEKLNITMKCYSNKREAKAWRDSIAKIIHPDKCDSSKATDAICKLNQLYEDMIGEK